MVETQEIKAAKHNTCRQGVQEQEEESATLRRSTKVTEGVR